jgi:hypothetical protein
MLFSSITAIIKEIKTFYGHSVAVAPMAIRQGP